MDCMFRKSSELPIAQGVQAEAGDRSEGPLQSGLIQLDKSDHHDDNVN